MAEKLPYYRQESLTREQLLGNREFLHDASVFLQERTGKTHAEPTQILDNFMELMRFSMVNEGTAFGNLTHVRRSDAEAKDRMGKMFLAFDASTGATGKVQTGLDYLEGLIKAPSTIATIALSASPFTIVPAWLGRGAVAGGAKAAVQLTRQLALRETARKAVGQLAVPPTSTAAKAAAMRDIVIGQTGGRTSRTAALARVTRGQYARAGARRFGLVEGGFGAAHGYAEATALKETGREEFKDIDAQTRMAVYGGLGLGAGALTGTIGGALKFTSEQKAMDLYGRAFTAQVDKAIAAAGNFDQFLRTLTSKQRGVAEVTAKKFTEDLRALNREQVAAGTAKFWQIQQRIAPDSEDFILSLAEPVRKNLINAATEWIVKTGIGRKSGERFTEYFSRALGDMEAAVGLADPHTYAPSTKILEVRVGKTTLQELFKVTEKYGLNFAHFSHLLMADASHAGRTLKTYGEQAKLFRNLAGAVKQFGLGSREVGGKVVSLLTPDEISHYSVLAKAVESGKVKLWRGFENVNKARLGFMTMQTATTIRNTINATIRTPLYALNHFFQGLRHWDIDQMRTGIVLGHHLLNPAEAQIIKLIHHMNAPDQVARMYRQLADVAAADPIRTKGMSTWLLKGSMFLNRINTLSDNMFKQAIFATELTMRVGGRKNLINILQEGNFNKIDTEVISQSMQEALHFVYQKSYRGSKGKGVDSPRFSERMAHGFVKTFSHPIGAAAVPFPRFMMNSLEFVLKHAPIIGMADPALFLRKIGVTDGYRKVTRAGQRRTSWRHMRGIKSKDPETGRLVYETTPITGGEYTERIVQQLTGTAMLYGAIQLRANQGPGARFWELYDEETGLYKDVGAFWGPFLPWLFMADIALHTTLLPESFILNKDARKKWTDIAKDRIDHYLFSSKEKKSRKRFLETLRSLGNTQLVKGFGGDVYKEVQKDLLATGFFTDIEDKQVQKRSAIALGKFVGNWFNTFTVAAGEVRDVMGTLNPKMYGTIFSANIQEERPGFRVNLLDQVLRTGMRSFPIKPYEDPETGEIRGQYALPFGLEFEGLSPILPVLPATKTAGEQIARAGILPGTPPFPLERQLTGQTPIGYKNLFEEELARVNLEGWEVFPNIRGDPELTRLARHHYQTVIEKNILPLITSRGYQNLDHANRRRTLTAQIPKFRGNVLNVLEAGLRRAVHRFDNQDSPEYKKKNRQLARVLRLKLGEEDQDVVQDIIDSYNTTFGRKPNLTNVEHLDNILRALKK